MKAQRVRTVRKLWMVHFLLGFFVICLGVLSNGGGRKYIPVNAISVSPRCQKAYVNVFANSPSEIEAIVCCDGSHDIDEWSWLTGSYADALCAPTPKYLPFARRLTKFPDSWLLPLVPILLRIVTVTGLSTSNDDFLKPHHSLWVTARRFISYILVMNFRGWALYIFFNMVQDVIVKKNMGSMGKDGERETSTCWYQHLLDPGRHINSHSICHGQRFDFSDHIVLFFGHVLPVVLFEVLFCVLLPFWPHNLSISTTAKSGSSSCSTKTQSQGDNFCKTLNRGKRALALGIVQSLLLISFIYLNILVFLVVHRTAAYFHTSLEVLVGYVISLLVQLPLGVLLWGTQCTGRWDRVRNMVGLPSYSGSIRED